MLKLSEAFGSMTLTYRSSELEIVVTLDPLLCNGLSNPFTVTSLELPSQQVTQPPFQKWHDTTQEEEPYSPPRRPDTAPWTLTNWTLIKFIKKFSSSLYGQWP